MSSVLFQKIREDRGLAYSVFAYHDTFSDTGVFEINLGTDRKHLRKALISFSSNAASSGSRRLSSSVLDEAKAQVRAYHPGHGVDQLAHAPARTSGNDARSISRLMRTRLMRWIGVKDSDILRVANTVLDESADHAGGRSEPSDPAAVPRSGLGTDTGYVGYGRDSAHSTRLPQAYDRLYLRGQQLTLRQDCAV